MAEYSVTQRSREWHDLRSSVCLTASHFGDALGVGQGKPYDFLQALLSPSYHDIADDDSEACRHGCELEPLIDRAYQRLTGRRTETGGFWVATDGVLSGLVGASPDAKVYIRDDSGTDVLTGLAEYKAPLYSIYTKPALVGTKHFVPRRYMAQMHGQMALCDLPWCDFMAVCSSTRNMLLYRVRFSISYWQSISAELYKFCCIVQEARQRQRAGVKNLLDFELAQELNAKGMHKEAFDGEMDIIVENLLETRIVERCASVIPSRLYENDTYKSEGKPQTPPIVRIEDVIITDGILGEQQQQHKCEHDFEQNNACIRDKLYYDDSIDDFDLEYCNADINCDGSELICTDIRKSIKPVTSNGASVAPKVLLVRDLSKSLTKEVEYKSVSGKWINFESVMI